MNNANKPTGLSTAALVCGIVGLCCINPLSLLTVAALVFGLIALINPNCGGKGMAITGVCLGCLQIIVEIVLAIFSFGTTLLF